MLVGKATAPAGRSVKSRWAQWTQRMPTCPAWTVRCLPPLAWRICTSSVVASKYSSCRRRKARFSDRSVASSLSAMGIAGGHCETAAAAAAEAGAVEMALAVSPAAFCSILFGRYVFRVCHQATINNDWRRCGGLSGFNFAKLPEPNA